MTLSELYEQYYDTGDVTLLDTIEELEYGVECGLRAEIYEEVIRDYSDGDDS